MRNTVLLLLALWAIAFCGSFVAAYLTKPDDFGFTRGMNRMGAFLAWQAVALVLAVICLVFRWSSKDEFIRKLAAVPSIFVGVLIVGFAAFYLWAIT